MIAAPKLWNALPQELREETNVDIFNTGLKTYLFRKHFNCKLQFSIFNATISFRLLLVILDIDMIVFFNLFLLLFLCI